LYNTFMKILKAEKPKEIFFTKDGFAKMEKDFASLTQKRKEVVVRLQTAREMGDLSENGAYQAARFELSSVDRELGRLKYLLRWGVVGRTKNNGLVDFGSSVTLKNGDKKLIFTMVSSFEADPAKQKLSLDSPLGKAIAGKCAGDKVAVDTPSGKTSYTIIKV